MRTVTLGALIVSVGTLTALPFRRYQAEPDASSAPAQVTGPIQSALDAPADESPVGDLAAQNAAASQTHPTWKPDNILADLAATEPSVTPLRDRSMDMPLTYEDLAIPIDLPESIQHRFSATADVRRQQLERELAAGIVMPDMETLAVTQQQELLRAGEQFAAEIDRRATASLASSPQDHQIEPLPEAEPVERERHWIRQP